MYINGHFCYAYKFGIITNGLGIVRDITFYNKDFLNAHPDIVIGKKTDSPDEDKSLADSKALLPVLIDFFQKHPLINPKTFSEIQRLIPSKSINPFLETSDSKKPLYLCVSNFPWKMRVIPLMRTVFHAVHMIPHFP